MMKATSAFLAAFALSLAATGAQAQQQIAQPYSDPVRTAHYDAMEWEHPGMMGMGHHGMMDWGQSGMGMGHHGMMGMGGPGMGMGRMGMMGMGGGDHSRKMILMMMAVVDTNSDGSLSLEEVQAVHSRVFNYIDSNKDGKVTPDELQSAFGGGGGQAGGMPMGGAPTSGAPAPAQQQQQGQ